MEVSRRGLSLEMKQLFRPKKTCCTSYSGNQWWTGKLVSAYSPTLVQVDISCKNKKYSITSKSI